MTICEACAGTGTYENPHGPGAWGCSACDTTGLAICSQMHFCCKTQYRHKHLLPSNWCPLCFGVTNA